MSQFPVLVLTGARQTGKAPANALGKLPSGVCAPAVFPQYQQARSKDAWLYFLDTGLLSFLLKYPDPQTLFSGPSAGPLFENYVVTEIFKTMKYRGPVITSSWNTPDYHVPE